VLAPEYRILCGEGRQGLAQRLAQRGWEGAEEILSHQFIGFEPAKSCMGSVAKRDAEIVVDPADHLRLVLDDGAESAFAFLKRSSKPRPV
jgi:hypothetical protein